MSKLTVCILDYGSGNVKSVYNMVSSLSPKVTISNDPKYISSATHLILPGVGAFKTSVQKIHKTIPLDLLDKEVHCRKKPFLGICVGMQVLALTGNEFEVTKGLGWVRGEVVKLETNGLPLPHIGWNNVSIKKSSPILKQFNTNQDFYFVHSFVLKTEDATDIVATTDYGEKFTSVIQKENVYGVQFHPEKSQKAGRILMENFLALR